MINKIDNIHTTSIVLQKIGLLVVGWESLLDNNGTIESDDNALLWDNGRNVLWNDGGKVTGNDVLKRVKKKPINRR